MMKKALTLALIAIMACGTTLAQPRQMKQVRQQPRQMPMRGQQMAKEKSIQLYSLRDLIGSNENFAANQKEVLGKLKEFGYTSIEAANFDGKNFYGLAPEAFKATVEEAGLQVLSSHATRGLSDDELAKKDFTESLKWWETAIPAHVQAGMKYIVSPWTNFPKTLEEAKLICDYHNAVGQMCKKAGLRYGYHNHSHEFKKIEGTDVVWYDFFVQNTNPDYVFFQLDVYWCMMAQQSPVEYFKRYPQRFTMLHVKDKYEIGGSGMVGFDAIFKNAEIAGLRDYVVEIEGTDGTMDIVKACQISSQYLNRQPAVKRSYSPGK